MNYVRPDIRVEFRLLSTREGGRESAIYSGYRGNVAIKDDYLTCGHTVLLNCEVLEPGQTAVAHISLARPKDYPHTVWRGKQLRIQEGGRIVGYARVIEVFNPLLFRRTPEEVSN